MKHLPIQYQSDHNVWQLSCPRAPTPAQVAWLKGWLADQARRLPEGPARLAAYEGRVVFNVLGDRMDGKGDIRLFEAPKPREVIGVF